MGYCQTLDASGIALHQAASTVATRSRCMSTRISRACAGTDDAGALDALEHDPVQSSSELNVALAYGASAGENRSFRHILCLRILGLPLDW